MNALHHWAIRHPRRTMLIAFALLLPVAAGVLRLELRTDGRALVPEGDPAIRIDDEIRATFRVEDPIVVLIESDDARGVFNFETLSLVRALSEALEQLPSAGSVLSLANEASDRLAPDALRFLPFLEPFPADEADLARVRDDVHALRIYSGTLVSFDEQATAIFVGMPAHGDRAQLVRSVRETLDAVDAGRDRVHLIGAPVAEVLLGDHLLRDLGVPAFLLGDASGRWGGLVPLALALVLLVFWVVFKTPLAALPPLIEVGACTLAVFGVMGWCGVPVYLTIAVLPVILVTMGLADEIHVFERYRQLAHERPDEAAGVLVGAALDDKWGAVVKTSVTTAVGFLSFTLSPIAAVRAFGVFTALGILLCMLWTLTVIPAMLVSFGPGRLFSRRARGSARLAHGLARLAGACAARPRTVVACAAAAAVLSVFGVARVRVQDGWISGFSPASALRRATERFDERFFGTHRLLVCVDAGHSVREGVLEPEHINDVGFFLPAGFVDDPQTLIGSRLRVWPLEPPERESDLREWTTVIESVHDQDGRFVVSTQRVLGSVEMMRRYWGGGALGVEVTPRRMLRPDVLQRIGRLEDLFDAQVDCGVGGTLGPVEYLETTSFLYGGRAPGARAVPQDTVAVEKLWHNYGATRGETRLRQVVNEDFSRALIEVYLTDANYADTERLLRRVRDWEREELAPDGLSLSFSGDVATSQALIDAVVTTQVRSLLASLVGIVLIVALFTRSLAWGLLAALPSSLSVLFNFALMGALDIPLGVATSMFAAMTLGIGVDYAIHFIEWTRRASADADDDPVAQAMRVTGPAILVDALAVALGFGVLALSQVPANARLGLLLVSSIGGCLVVTLVLLPALIRLGSRARPPARRLLGRTGPAGLRGEEIGVAAPERPA